MPYGVVLPDKVVETTRRYIDDFYSSFMSIAFILPSCNSSQQSFSLIKNINKYLDVDPYTEFSIYTANKDLPIMVPLFAVYPAIDLNIHNGYLIVSDFRAYQIARQKGRRAKICYYAYDLNEFNHLKPEFIQNIKDNCEVIFTRTKEHREFLVAKFNLKIDNIVVPDYEIEPIVRMLLDQDRNTQTNKAPIS